MTKVTIGVYKAFKNGGRFRFHRNKTKKHWKHYFIEVDDYDEDEYSFGSEWVSAFKAVILKRKQQYKKTFYCSECEKWFTAYVPKNTTKLDECPFCED